MVKALKSTLGSPKASTSVKSGGQNHKDDEIVQKSPSKNSELPKTDEDEEVIPVAVSSEKNVKPEKKPKALKTLDQSKRGRKRKFEEKENVIDASIVEDLKSINMVGTVAEATTSEFDPDKEGKDSSEKTKSGQKSVVAVGDSDKDKDVSDKPKSRRKASVKNNDADENQELLDKHNSRRKSGIVVDNKEDYDLPKGWSRKDVVRKSGKTAGQIDVYIYSPDGTKFRSKPEVSAYLKRTKSALKLENFNFSKKKSSGVATTETPKHVQMKKKGSKKK